MTESTIFSQDLTLGQQLREAREALNLTVEDVAQKTNLKKAHIESLENDLFVLQNVAPTFVRGYVRNYIRFLHLPEELVSSVNYGEVKLPTEVINKKPSEKAIQRSQNAWVKYLTIAILLAAIGMTLIWWYQDYQKEQENREKLVSNALPVETSTIPTQEPIQQEMPKPTVEATQAKEDVAQNTSEPTTAEPTATESATTEAQSEAEELKKLQEELDAAEANELQEEPAAEPAQESDSTAIYDELRIEISGKESWVTVKTANNKGSLAERLYTNGEVLTFNENDEYRLTIGAPANVKIYYKGQEVPLKIDGRVARIKLPLAP